MQDFGVWAEVLTVKLLPFLALAGALSIWAPNAAHAGATGMFGLARNSPAAMDVVQNRQRVGPFATWTRANEVANYYRQMGYNANTLVGRRFRTEAWLWLRR